MQVVNIHERVLPASKAEVGRLIDTLASAHDLLWPREQWPALRFDRGLRVGSTGGHGPIRYRIEVYEQGARIVCRFTRPTGFSGTHAFVVLEQPGGRTMLRHELRMTAEGPARVTWPLVFRPLHDALLEDSLDKAERQVTGAVAIPNRWSWYVRLLRWIATSGRRQKAESRNEDLD